ncbi:MAG: hypothetical protein JWP59_78 [Massilia sp.]|nr:hypothetical protein [Massilia sp.]
MNAKGNLGGGKLGGGFAWLLLKVRVNFLL